MGIFLNSNSLDLNVSTKRITGTMVHILFILKSNLNLTKPTRIYFLLNATCSFLAVPSYERKIMMIICQRKLNLLGKSNILKH